MLCLVIAAFTEAFTYLRFQPPRVPYGFAPRLLLSALGGGAVLLTVPILAVLPYANAFKEKMKNIYFLLRFIFVQ
jgi:hypothetical protein